jgi:hypothetical protein
MVELIGIAYRLGVIDCRCRCEDGRLSAQRSAVMLTSHSDNGVYRPYDLAMGLALG